MYFTLTPSFTSRHRNLAGKFAPAGAPRKPSFPRRLAASLIAAELVLGTASVAALVSAVPASAAPVLGPHGDWQCLSIAINGETYFGAMVTMDKGRVTAFLANGDTPTLAMTDPNWNFKVNSRLPLHVEIDGESFIGTANVSGRNFIEVPNLSTKLVKKLAGGAEAVVDIDDGYIVRTLDLHGLPAAMSDSLKGYKASYE